MIRYGFLQENLDKKLRFTFSTYVDMHQFELARAVLGQLEPPSERQRLLQETLERPFDDLPVKVFCLSELDARVVAEHYYMDLLEFELVLRNAFDRRLLSRTEVECLDASYVLHLKQRPIERRVIYSRLFPENSDDDVSSNHPMAASTPEMDPLEILRGLLLAEPSVANALSGAYLAVAPHLRDEIHDTYVTVVLDATEPLVESESDSMPTATDGVSDSPVPSADDSVATTEDSGAVVVPEDDETSVSARRKRRKRRKVRRRAVLFDDGTPPVVAVDAHVADATPAPDSSHYDERLLADVGVVVSRDVSTRQPPSFFDTPGEALARSTGASLSTLSRRPPGVDDGSRKPRKRIEIDIRKMGPGGLAGLVEKLVELVNFLSIDSEREICSELKKKLIQAISNIAYLEEKIASTHSKDDDAVVLRVHFQCRFVSKLYETVLQQREEQREEQVKMIDTLDTRWLKQHHFLEYFLDSVLSAVGQRRAEVVDALFASHPNQQRLRNLVLMLVFDELKENAADLPFLDRLFDSLLVSEDSSDNVDGDALTSRCQSLEFCLDFSRWLSGKIVEFSEGDPSNIPLEFKEKGTIGDLRVRKVVFDKLYSRSSILYVCLPFANLFIQRNELYAAMGSRELQRLILQQFYVLNDFLRNDVLSVASISALFEGNAEEEHQLSLFENLYSLTFVKVAKTGEFKFNRHLELIDSLLNFMQATLTRRFPSLVAGNDSSASADDGEKGSSSAVADSAATQSLSPTYVSRANRLLAIVERSLFKLSLIKSFDQRDGVVNWLCSAPLTFLCGSLKLDRFDLARLVNDRFSLGRSELIAMEENYKAHQSDALSNPSFPFLFDLAFAVPEGGLALLQKSHELLLSQHEDRQEEVDAFFTRVQARDWLVEVESQDAAEKLRRWYSFFDKLIEFSRSFDFAVIEEFLETSSPAPSTAPDTVSGEYRSGDPEESGKDEQEGEHSGADDDVLPPPVSEQIEEADLDAQPKTVVKHSPLTDLVEFQLLRLFVSHLKRNSVLLNSKDVLKKGIKKFVCRLIFEDRNFEKALDVARVNHLDLLRIVWWQLLREDEGRSSSQCSLDVDIVRFLYSQSPVVAILAYVMLRKSNSADILAFLLERSAGLHPILHNWLRHLFSETWLFDQKDLCLNKERYYLELIADRKQKELFREALELAERINATEEIDAIILAMIERDPSRLMKLVYRVNDSGAMLKIIFEHHVAVEDVDSVVELFQLAVEYGEPGTPDAFNALRKLQEFLLLKEIILNLHFDSWKDLTHRIHSDLPDLIAQLNKIEKFDLSRRLLRFFDHSNHELFIEIEKEFLLSKLLLPGGERVKMTKLLHILVAYDAHDALRICRELLEYRDLDADKKIFLCNFIITALRKELMEEQVDVYENTLVGLKIFQAVRNKETEDRFKHLINHPRLILENLIMMKEVDVVRQIMEQYGEVREAVPDADRLFISYALKALDLSSRRSSSASGNADSSSTPGSLRPASLRMPLSSVVSPGSRSTSPNPFSIARRHHSMDVDAIAAATRPASRPSPPPTLTGMFYLNGDGQDEVKRDRFRFDVTPNLLLAKTLFDMVSRPRAVGQVLLSFLTKIRFNVQYSQHSNLELIELMEKLMLYCRFCFVKDTEGHEDFSYYDNVNSKFSVLKLLVFSSANDALEDCPLSLGDLLDQNRTRQIRDYLVKNDYIRLALKLSKRSGIETAPILVEWGVMLLKLNNFREARAKFEEALQSHRISRMQQGRGMLEDILPILRNKSAILMKMKPDFEMASKVMEEAKYYLQVYGSEEDYVRFFVSVNEIEEILAFVKAKKVSRQVFQELVVPYLYSYGYLDRLRELVSSRGGIGGRSLRGSQANEYTEYLEIVCRFLHETQAYHLLYDFYLFLNNQLKCGTTCIRIYVRTHDVEWLEKAQDHLLKLQTTSGPASSRNPHQRSSSQTRRRQRVSVEYMRTIKNELELRRIRGLQLEKTLFDQKPDQQAIVVELIVGHFLTRPRRELAHRIIKEYDLSTKEMFSRAIAKLIETGKRERDIAAHLKEMTLLLRLEQSPQDRDVDELYVATVAHYADAGKLNPCKKLIPRIQDVSLRIKACLACQWFRNAFKYAVEDAQNVRREVRKLREALGDIDTTEALAVLGFCDEWLQEHG